MESKRDCWEFAGMDETLIADLFKEVAGIVEYPQSVMPWMVYNRSVCVRD
jgi:hypothetical protein